MQRRSFLAATAGALVAPRLASAANAQITVLANEPIAAINPLVHGHFVEHLGGVVYDGIWVGENSKIANIGGLRKSLVDALKKIQAPVFRWPGGCFADSYQWKDGIGPRAQRPKRTNFWEGSSLLRKLEDSPARYDPNTFGTNEFMRFCRETGGKPYFAVNVRSSTPKEFYEWVEYCNAPSGRTTWSNMRGEAPYNVEFWGIGNESWGCGGNYTPEEYSVEYRKFTAWAPGYGVPLKYLPSGPNGGDLNWTRGFFEAMLRKDRNSINNVWGWALHYYCGTTGKSAVDYTDAEFYDLLARAQVMEDLINRHWTIMGQYDREHRIKFAIDEWGTWHREGTQVGPDHLFGQQATMRDALVAGLTLDIFHRHADKVSMGCIAQLINCLQSLFLAHEDQFVLTANYHVFDLYRAHQNGTAVRAVFGAPLVEKAPRLAGSASVKDKVLTLTGVNTHLTEPLAAAIEVAGAAVKSARLEVLSSPDSHHHNTFAQPNRLVPRPAQATASGSSIKAELPPISVWKITADLA